MPLALVDRAGPTSSGVVIHPSTLNGESISITLPSNVLTGTVSYYLVTTSTNSTTRVIHPGWPTLPSNGTSLNTSGFITTSTSLTWSNTYTSSWSESESKFRQEQQKKYARERAAAVHRAKNSIKRALKLMDGVGFGKDVQVFLGGDSIEVSHPDSLFKFLLTKSKFGTLIDKTISPGYSTPYNLQLYTKTDVHVANLCVYMEKTPVLDQVLALSMYIKSGNEDLILQQANWSLYADAAEAEAIAQARPDLRKKLRLDRVPERAISFNNANARIVGAFQ